MYKALLKKAYEKHAKCGGAILSSNFMECAKCELHVHLSAFGLVKHWGEKYDKDFIGDADDPRLDVQRQRDEAFNATTILEIIEDLAKTWISGEVTTWREALSDTLEQYDLAIVDTNAQDNIPF